MEEVKKKKTLMIVIIVTISLLIILLTGYLIFPKLKLKDSDITISYKEEYKEPGYSLKIFNKSLNNIVKVSNNIKKNKVGTYKVIYEYKILFIKLKKERIVNIVDKEKPTIEVEDSIKLCPKDGFDKINYSIVDEYDGDISKNATFTENGNKLLISASDSSNNMISKEIEFSREDLEKPMIKLSGYSTMYVSRTSKYTEPGFEATDNCDGDLTSKVEVSGTVGSSAGTYKITYKVTDESNNTYSVERKVVVYNYTQTNSGTAANGSIYLTFDDGPNEGTTNYILDVLKSENVKATFFVTGNGPDYLIKRMHDEGHTVALHTYTHNYATVYSSVDNYFNDLNRISSRVSRITGVESKIVRFPGGSSNTVSKSYSRGIMTTLTSMLLERGYRYYDWNVDSNDAGGAGSSQAVYYNVINSLSKYRANMVLMHDIKYTTKGAIKDIIQYGKANGYTFEPITMNTYMIRHGVNN